MTNLATLLRAAAELWDRFHGAHYDDRPTSCDWEVGHDAPPSDAWVDECLSDSHDPFEDLLDDEEGDDWRRWYDQHRTGGSSVPSAVASACLEDIREAGILHSVALLEITRKWGFEPRG